MDIKLPLPPNLPLAVNKASDSGLSLKLNQVLAAKVIENQTMLNTLTLEINNKTVTVQAPLPIDIKPGQSIQLQVTRLLPTPELKLVSSLPLAQTAPNPVKDQDQPTLRLIHTTMPTPLTPTAKPMTSSDIQTVFAPGTKLQANVIAVTGDRVTLQVTLPAPSAQPIFNKPDSLLLTLDTKQLISQSGISSSEPHQAGPLLKEGVQIQLQLIQSGDKPVFVITPSGSDTEQKIVDALKQMLPLQTSPTPLLNQLQQALPELIADASVSETLKNLAQKILSSLATSSQLAEPATLKQLVKESGLFLEGKLLALLQDKPGISLPDDFKFKLSKVIVLLSEEIAAQTDGKSSAAQDLLKEILQKAQGALAKLTIDQFNSLPKEDSPKQTWVLELPFFHDGQPESVKIEIERDAPKKGESAEKNWAVSVTITPPELGTIHCRISCYDGTVNTRFWSDVAGTVERINAHLDYLKQQFESKGLTPGFMEAHQGQPAQTDYSKAQMPHLLSEKA